MSSPFVAASHLNESGLHNAIHPRARARRREPDHLAFVRAIEEDRIIVTENTNDFRKRAAGVDLHPCLIILPSVARGGAAADGPRRRASGPAQPRAAAGCAGEFGADDREGRINSGRAAAMKAPNCGRNSMTIEELPDFPALLQVARSLWREGTARGAAVLVGAGFSWNATLFGRRRAKAPALGTLSKLMAKELYSDPNTAPADPQAADDTFARRSRRP